MKEDLQCRIYPAGSLHNLKFVVICSFFKGERLLSKHKSRDTWETQGGHIEKGESPLDAAKRELYEESGVTEAKLYYVCDYLGFTSSGSANGAVFLADISELGVLPESEMEKAELFTRLPHNLTYPLVTPKLFEESEKFALENHIF